MKFSEQLRQAADASWNASFEHPFVQGIGDGTLPLDCFRHYVLNDAYYLSQFARVQALGAAKADDLYTVNRMAVHAQGTYGAELSLHEKFAGLLGITDVNPNNPMGATYRTYTDDLRVMDQAVKAQLPVVTRTNISLNGPTAHVRLDVPAGTDQAAIERIRAQAQEALAAAVPRYKYKVSVAVK